MKLIFTLFLKIKKHELIHLFLFQKTIRSEQMVRPKVHRRIVKEPEHNCLKHGKIEIEGHNENIEMNLDEFEAIRLGDYHNIKQKEAAELMGISQPTFNRILNSARKKTAVSLIEGRQIEINNLNFNVEGNSYKCNSCGFEWQNPNKEYSECPDCKSKSIQLIENDIAKDPGTYSNSEISDAPLNMRKSFRGSGSGEGPSKSCICKKCGYQAPKIRGFPCRNLKCPKCGIPLSGSKKLAQELNMSEDDLVNSKNK